MRGKGGDQNTIRGKEGEMAQNKAKRRIKALKKLSTL
jgi:hypothetical protein